jgi:hypothetical protein
VAGGQRNRRRRARREHHGLIDSLVDGASEIVQSVANEVAPGVVGALDVDQVVQRVDFQAVVDRVDLQSVLERIDLEALLDTVDLDLLMQRLDVNRLLARIDVDALLQRVDINALLAQTELGEVMARSGSAVVARGVDVMRSQGVGLDSFIHRWVDRLLRRGAPVRATGPPLLVPTTDVRT